VSAAAGKSGSSADHGSIAETVPSKRVATEAAVPLTSTADFGNKVTAVVTAAKSINATAQGPGEIAGPAVAISLTIKNTSGGAIDLSSVIVNLQDKAGTPSNPMSASPAKPVSGKLASGATASGVYVFSLPRSHLNPVTISVSYTTEAPVVLFVGDAK
jgi:hypothetical protein